MSRRATSNDHGTEADERWVISYADLVTLLLGFFIILYATADANQVKFEALARGLSEAFNVPVKEGTERSSIFDGGSGIVPADQGAIIDRDLAAIREMVSDRIAAAGVQGDILVSRDDDRIVIRLADNLLFASASAELRADSLPLLDIVAEALEGIEHPIRVEGHTDNVPVGTDAYPSNWELSAARATAVLRYLAEEAGIDPARMFAAGFGEYRPIADNLTPEGRALNRRADVVILYPQATIGGASEPEGLAQ